MDIFSVHHPANPHLLNFLFVPPVFFGELNEVCSLVAVNYGECCYCSVT